MKLESRLVETMTMPNTLKSSSSVPREVSPSEIGRPSAPLSAATGWLKVGAIAAASAALGGLAAAWFYRKALSQLREAENQVSDSLGHSTGDGSEEDF